MNLFSKRTLRNLGLSVLSAVALSACGGAGSCSGNNCTPIPPSPSGDVTLTLTAPNQYPAGVAVTAYLTMTNTSQYNATNLYYNVPSDTNYTGATITVANGAGNPCVNIAAGASCTFPAQIAENSHPGSFTVTATPNGSSSTSSSILNSLKSTLGLQAATLSLTANIGLTDVPANTNSGANGITFLYSSTVAASESGDTLLSVVGVVNSVTAGAFNTINLTDATGTKLNFSVLSGNSGDGLTNLAKGSVVSFLLKIPSGTSSYKFYAQTMENNTVVDLGTTAYPITLGSASSGILVVQPTDFALSANNNYQTQVVTFSNIGNGNVTGLTMPTLSAPMELVATTCGSTLTPANTTGSSCTYTIKSNAPVGVSAQGSLTATSDNGSAVANYTYAGKDPVAGISITSGSNPTFNFVSNTVTTATSSQITLTNTGDTSANSFTFTVPTNFALTAGTTGTPCTISNNVVSTILANKNDSCTLTLTYTNGTVTSQSTANLLVDYKYGTTNLSAPQSSVGLTYSTQQAAAVLEVTDPTTSPYTFNSIVANNVESQTKVFTVKNTGTGPASNIANGGLVQGPIGDAFTVVPSTPASEECGAGKSTLAVGGTCLMTVRFGPIAQQSGLKSKTLNLTYLPYASAPTSTLGIKMQGTLIAPLAANIVVNNIALSPAASGGNGESTDTPFAIAKSTQTIFTLTYKNTGTYAASEFTVDATSLTGYSVKANNCNNVNLAINATCTVELSLSADTQGANDLELGNLVMSWKDQRSPNDPITGVPSSWVNGDTTLSTAYVNVYAPASVAAVMSSESDGTPTITSVKTESDFYVVFTLTGGYNVSDMTYGVNLTNAAGGTPPISVVGSSTCTVSSQKPTCAIKLKSGGPITNQNIGYTTTGTVTPSPSTSGNFNVTATPANLVITPSTTADFGDVQRNNIDVSTRVFKVENTGDIIATGLDFNSSDDYDSYLIIPPPNGTPTPFCNITYGANSSLAGGSSCYVVVQFGTFPTASPLGPRPADLKVSYYSNSGSTQLEAKKAMTGNVVAVPAPGALSPGPISGATGACLFSVTGLPQFTSSTSVSATDITGTGCSGAVACENDGSGNVLCTIYASPGNLICSTTLSSPGYSDYTATYNLISCR